MKEEEEEEEEEKKKDLDAEEDGGGGGGAEEERGEEKKNKEEEENVMKRRKKENKQWKGVFGVCELLLLLANMTNKMDDEPKKDEDKQHGGCEGPNAMYVKLISSDGHEFIVKREHALMSGTIKAMLSGPGQFAENETNEINFREIPSHVLQKVCMYFTYKVRYTNSSTEIPEFPIAPAIALELLMAANFLDC
ncbi:hypothetical protein M8J77_010443 [Diaphorina citri]|nr:hypothetical protein M8J77_010443 [Diaphorina citri]